MTEVLQAIPAVTDAIPQYLAVASQATAITDVVTIDKIEIYGTVTANLSPSIVPDVTSKYSTHQKEVPEVFLFICMVQISRMQPLLASLELMPAIFRLTKHLLLL
jgi:hypothetical protein